MLQPNLTARDGSTESCEERQQGRIDARCDRTLTTFGWLRVMKHRDQANQGDDDECAALNQAERARHEAHHMLHVERGQQQQGADYERDEIERARGGQGHACIRWQEKRVA